jgi:hypothetical protein
MNENAFIERYYENILSFQARKNKAKQSQSPGFGRKSEIRQFRLCSWTPVAPCRSGNKMIDVCSFRNQAENAYNTSSICKKLDI